MRRQAGRQAAAGINGEQQLGSRARAGLDLAQPRRGEERSRHRHRQCHIRIRHRKMENPVEGRAVSAARPHAWMPGPGQQGRRSNQHSGHITDRPTRAYRCQNLQLCLVCGCCQPNMSPLLHTASAALQSSCTQNNNKGRFNRRPSPDSGHREPLAFWQQPYSVTVYFSSKALYSLQLTNTL